MFERILDVLVICVPVFGLIGLGWWLERRGRFNPAQRDFAANMVFRYALPSLVFIEITKLRFSDLFNPAVMLAPFAAIAVIAVLYIALAALLGYRRGLAAAFVFGTFWANVSYLGFPLCQSAFGPVGLAQAAIYNAIVMPSYIAFSLLLMHLYKAGSGSSRTAWMQILSNPIIRGAVLGVVVSALGELLRGPDGMLRIPFAMQKGLLIAQSFLKLVGGMGLPLALLAIGGDLKPIAVHVNRTALTGVVIGKLFLLPALTWAAIAIFMPHAAIESRGVAVLLAATPSAISSYVVARQIGVPEAETFIAPMLVVSHLVSIISIPVWLYFLLS
jgi:predicted permease